MDTQNGMSITSTTKLELAFPKTVEEEREEEEERRRWEEERGRRNLPLQRVIGRTATTPRPSTSLFRSQVPGGGRGGGAGGGEGVHSDSGSEGVGVGGGSDSDREGVTPKGGGRAATGKSEEAKIVTPRLTLIVPPLTPRPFATTPLPLPLPCSLSLLHPT